ncbi:hypothetical protein HA402_005407 [Bradysia odoriphaga]|nr:hypothetical protein HA402_005407 [Bradysia odoriphaga]
MSSIPINGTSAESGSVHRRSCNTWTMGSWRTCPILQQPRYEDPSIAESTLKTISSLPALVHHAEIEELKRQLAQVANGERFILQAGDCAERFVDCNENSITNRLKALVHMSQVLAVGGLPIVVMGRVAGQYGKPLSTFIEHLPDGQRINRYRGDIINGFEQKDREYDPARLLSGYFHSAATLNYMRALEKNNFREIAAKSAWNSLARRCEEIKESIPLGHRPQADLFTSHEGLVLDYEEALTRSVVQDQSERFYNVGAHFLWIGKRTRHINNAHVEYFRGISNPIGVKIDSELSARGLLELLDVLDPDKIPGRVTLISRFGYRKVATDLPERVEAVRRAGRENSVIWCCDPMHGNTYTTREGMRTRNFDDVLSELTETLNVLRACGCRLGGIHLESTGEDVTECIGGPQNIDETQLNLRYSSYVDPRLNYVQSLEIVFLFAEQLRNQ